MCQGLGAALSLSTLGEKDSALAASVVLGQTPVKHKFGVKIDSPSGLNPSFCRFVALLGHFTALYRGFAAMFRHFTALFCCFTSLFRPLAALYRDFVYLHSRRSALHLLDNDRVEFVRDAGGAGRVLGEGIGDDSNGLAIFFHRLLPNNIRLAAGHSVTTIDLSEFEE